MNIEKRSKEEREADLEWLTARASSYLKYGRGDRASVAASAVELGYRLNGRGFAVSPHDVARIFNVTPAELQVAQLERETRA